MMYMKDVRESLQKWAKDPRRFAVVGVGNELRRDDFIGIRIVQGLRNKVPESVMLIESDTIPESHLESIIEFNPSHILLIDAGILGLKPGESKFIESSKALGPIRAAISTHVLPLRIFCEHLKKVTSAKIGFLIIQPARTDFGIGLSEDAKRAASDLEVILLEIISSTTKGS